MPLLHCHLIRFNHINSDLHRSTSRSPFSQLPVDDWPQQSYHYQHMVFIIIDPGHSRAGRWKEYHFCSLRCVRRPPGGRGQKEREGEREKLLGSAQNANAAQVNRGEHPTESTPVDGSVVVCEAAVNSDSLLHAAPLLLDAIVPSASRRQISNRSRGAVRFPFRSRHGRRRRLNLIVMARPEDDFGVAKTEKSNNWDRIAGDGRRRAFPPRAPNIQFSVYEVASPPSRRTS